MFNKLASYLKQWYRNMKIGKKIAFYYFVLLIASLSTSVFINERIYHDMVSQKVMEVSRQTLDSVYLSVNSFIASVDLSTYMLLYNTDVQEKLAMTDNSTYFDNLRYYSSVSNLNGPIMTRFYEVFHQNVNITSIYIFTLNNFEYSMYNENKKHLKVTNITSSNLYKEASAKGVPYVVKLNADGIFGDNTRERQNSTNNYISIVRALSSVETFKPLGISIVNIPQSALIKNIREISDKYGVDILIKDNNDSEIVSFNKHHDFDLANFLKKSGDKKYFSSLVKMDGKSYTASCLKDDKYNWILVGINPTEAITRESYKLYFINLVILLVNGIFIFFIGSFIITRLITKPIKKLINSMKSSENGKFRSAIISTGNDEIGELKDGYNMMISEIQRLISDIVTEQKLKRKYELNILHEQIKPHFLYNTFDSISSLALSAGNEEIFHLMCALGSYYKNSLSKGGEVITVGQEIDIVRNYLFILSYRYRELFTVHYDINDEILKYRTLKLILQPLVENSIYHGIKPKGEKGNISIAAYYRQNHVYFEVEDDGVGMEETQIRSVLSDPDRQVKKGFGIKGTMERLRIFYNAEDIFSIVSRVGQGTRVTIKIPVEKDGFYGG